MNDEIRVLIETLRRGQFENPSEKIALLSAALQEHRADVAFLVSLLEAPQNPLRLAALDAVAHRTEREILEAVQKLSGNATWQVRRRVSEILGAQPPPQFEETLRTLLDDPDEDVRAAAIHATAKRPEFFAVHRQMLKEDTEWEVRLAAVNAVVTQPAKESACALFGALDDDDSDVNRRAAERLEEIVSASPDEAEKTFPSQIEILARSEISLKGIGPRRFPTLVDWITSRTSKTVDPASLARFGTDLTALAEDGVLSHAFGCDEEIDILVKYIQRDPWRSIALLGPSGCGKSALVNELAYRLALPENGKWRILRISPSDFMAGTRYLGEWETKVRDIVEAIRKPRRVILYVPNLSDLSAAGSWSKSDSSVATALAPYLEDGSILLIGESAPEEFERGLGRIPSLSRLFEKVLVAEASLEKTHEIIRAVRTEEAVDIGDALLDQLAELSDQFLNHISRPGNALSLARMVFKIAKEKDAPVSRRQVLDTLSRSTGIPSELLDDTIPLQQSKLHAFFESRIMGQPEAISAVVDTITLIKAGLTDPNKPFGVFLFIGPTGVGKTELARALAEFIFGDTSRLKRFDMSEFARPEGFTRLIGEGNETGLLTDAVRQQPFSVVLLDEIEKSHINVFDLCLQIFDAGRLTDGRGRTVDFRRTIVILTSNIGAETISTPMGFRAGDPAPIPTADKDRTFRELSRFFRPEFLNRIDRIVSFRPLSLEVAEQIARRELSLVLQRSGIKRRKFSLDVDPSVISLLVREGYSPHFGARPLKRTVERILLLPLARAISSGALQHESLIRVIQTKGGIEVLPAPKAAPARPSKAGKQADKSLETKLEMIVSRVAKLQPGVQLMESRKSELLLLQAEPGFFKDAGLRSATYDEVHKLDEFLQLYARLLRGVENADRLIHGSRTRNGQTAPLREKLEKLASELEHVEFVTGCRNRNELADALLIATRVDARGDLHDSVSQLASIYSAFARRRHMGFEILGESSRQHDDSLYMLVSGLGSYRQFQSESGLHQFDFRFRKKNPKTGKETVYEDREVIRVDVLAFNSEPDAAFLKRVKATVTASPAPTGSALPDSKFHVALFDEATLRSLEIRGNGSKQDVLQKGLQLLYATAQMKDRATNSLEIVRHYDLGTPRRIKDIRSGRTTTNVEAIFNGGLGELIDFSSVAAGE